jgi:RecA/RadA recombinase
MSDRLKLSELQKDWKKAYKDAVMIGQANDGYRYSTGVVAYDIALGGGLKAGTINLIVGPESSAKTTIALKTAAQVQLINWKTGMVDPTYSDPTPVIYIDLENTFDPDWSRANGVILDEDAFVVVSPSYGEMMNDIVRDIISSHAAGLVIIDSLEPVMSSKENEKSAEESAGLGRRALVLNDCFRKWVSAGISSKVSNAWQNTTLFCINQFRDKIVMMGDPREVPGGKGQKFYSSTITYLAKGKLQKDKTSRFGMGEFSGVIDKNKTASPKKAFSFEMATMPMENHPIGYVDNVKTIWTFVKGQSDWISKGKDGWEVFGEVYRVQDDFVDKLSDPIFYAEVRNKVYARIAGK